MKLEIVLVLCCLALAHSLKIVNQNTAGTLACCGSGNTFDTTTQICCINTVFSIPSSGSNQQAACCGTSLLNNDQICCPANPGFVSTSDRAIANNLQCCGTKGYDPSTQLCCGGSVVSSSNGALQCCGSRGYNQATDLCCGTSVIANGATNGQTCCGSAGFNSATQLCCFNKVISNTNNNLQCCDATQFSTAFDPSTQTCCAGVVNTGASATCCGTRVFTAATQLCCAGNTIVGNPNANLECCGSSSYNPTTQTCCSIPTETTTIGAKNCDGCKTITTVTSTQTQVGSIPANVGLCCGLTAYDSTINQCCSGRVNPLSTTAGARTCCGTTTFNAAADLCCGTTVSNALPIVGGQSLANTECCGTSTFNTQTQTCQCGKQVAMTADIAFLGGEEACCGTTQYNNVSATCCSSSFGNFLYPLEPAAGFKCCPQDGKSLYNPGYQICCDTKTVCSGVPAKLTIRDVEEVSIDFRALKGQFNPRDSHNFDSLLEKHAEATRDVEEIEEVEDLEKKKKKKHKKKKHSKSGKSNKADSRDRTSGNIANNDKGKFPLVQCGDACCNGQGYFLNYQKCCGTPYTGYNVIDVSNTDAASSPLACCGDNIYNTNHQSCCQEVKSIDSCNVATANYGIFDPAVQLCCTA